MDWKYKTLTISVCWYIVETLEWIKHDYCLEWILYYLKVCCQWALRLSYACVRLHRAPLLLTCVYHFHVLSLSPDLIWLQITGSSNEILHAHIYTQRSQVEVMIYQWAFYCCEQLPYKALNQDIKVYCILWNHLIKFVFLPEVKQLLYSVEVHQKKKNKLTQHHSVLLW